MNQYVTGGVIKKLREDKGLTQSELAEKIGVSDKAVSKWETGRGLPDITLIEPITEALGISTIELLAGGAVTNENKGFSLRRTKLYVCPICGNIIHSTGEAVISCCGVTLPPLEAEEMDEAHEIHAELIEDEYYITIDHPMTKDHYISFIGAVTIDGIQMVKLYPEGPAEARVKRRGTREVYAYCNKHGLFKVNIKKK